MLKEIKRALTLFPHKGLQMWTIFFVLPNIEVQEPIGNDWISIVPRDDPRIAEKIEKNPFVRVLANKFEDQFERDITPSFLILPSNIPERLRDAEAIVGFRNAVALSIIISGHEHSLKSKFVRYPLYSDYFDFYPITVSKDNDGFITRSPAVSGFDDEYEKFRGQKSPSLAGLGSVSIKTDHNLLNLLINTWERRYVIRKSSEWTTTALFRSLEMAYQASTMPFKNHSTIYDYGSSASLWVSAFEILSHPRKGKANLLSVLKLLGGFDWTDKIIKRKSYKVKLWDQVHRVNLVQKLYKELYDTRNVFLHGNPVRPNRLHPFKNIKAPAITRFAPLLYKVALLVFLEQYRDKRKQKDWGKEYISKLNDERDLADGLLKSKN